MMILTTQEAVRHALTLGVPAERYAPLMELARLFIVQRGDPRELLEELRGRPFADWETITHKDGWYEAVFILSDAGEGDVVLIPDKPKTKLTQLCQANLT